jgi:hypothetical protein
MKHTEPGVEYDAKFDGKDYPVKGGDSGRTVALRRINALTVEEIWKAGGKEEFRSRMTLAADGKSLKNEILVDGKVTRSETALRQ